MPGGSKFTRTMQYFREADLDEVDAALGKASRIVVDRQRAATARKAGIADTPQRKRRATRKPAAQAAAAAAAGQTEQAAGAAGAGA